MILQVLALSTLSTCCSDCWQSRYVLLTIMYEYNNGGKMDLGILEILEILEIQYLWSERKKEDLSHCIFHRKVARTKLIRNSSLFKNNHQFIELSSILVCRIWVATQMAREPEGRLWCVFKRRAAQ